MKILPRILSNRIAPFVRALAVVSLLALPCAAGILRAGDALEIYAVASWTGSYWDDRIDMPPYPRPTHWMPLPPPPETTK